ATITAWGCFRARAEPLLRSPRRARGSRKRPLKQARAEPTMTSLGVDHGKADDKTRQPRRARGSPKRPLKQARAEPTMTSLGVDHGKADDKTRRTGPRDFVLRRDRHRPRRGRHPRACDAVHGDPGVDRATS